MSIQQQLYDKFCESGAPDKSKFLMFKTSMDWDWTGDAGYIHPVEHQLVLTFKG